MFVWEAVNGGSDMPFSEDLDSFIYLFIFWIIQRASLHDGWMKNKDLK